ncbi:acid-sensing ion channel 1-like [Asterias amurensis]|uniref:acid-sensing ion channel 1-like n=1 Tax=Asterias amurensis TaxID=7602 RepID=UPI003AB80194
MPYEDRHTTGHELDTMLLSCTFNAKHCSPENFTMFYNYRYGNCFTFNSGRESTPKLNVTKSGPNYGLSMELLIEQHQYIPDLENGAGVRISIHNQSSMPFPEDKGTNTSPGRETFIGVHKSFVQRLPSPYGDCQRVFQERNIFKTEFNHIHYTQKACLKDCYFKEVLEKCHCADVRYRYDDSLLACNTTINGMCIESIETSYADGTLNCSYCQMECSEVIFDKVVSSSVWPSRLYKDTLTWKIWDRMNNSRSLIEKEDKFVEENLLRVNVYFDQLEYEDIYQDPAYDVTSLLGDLGGNVGLWIGVSVLTMFEFLELVLDIAYLAYHGCRMVSEKSLVI